MVEVALAVFTDGHCGASVPIEAASNQVPARMPVDVVAATLLAAVGAQRISGLIAVVHAPLDNAPNL